MDTENLIASGNTLRSQNQPEQALSCYAQAFVQDHRHAGAFNNYGNVLREIGYPDRAIPFLQQAIVLDPSNITAKFNLAVAYLLMGDYQQGWKHYECRWNYEHLAGTLPQWSNRWQGQDINGKTLLLWAEQGLGDTLQFIRFAENFKNKGARIIAMVPGQFVDLLARCPGVDQAVSFENPVEHYDYWTPMMSVPGLLDINLSNLPRPIGYIRHDQNKSAVWRKKLGLKTRLRIGVCWSGRKDSWINQHKSVEFDQIARLISQVPGAQWINLQIDASESESSALANLGVDLYPGTIQSMDDTAALLSCLDLVISVDTAVAHLAGAMGLPTWIMLNQYAVDWRWLLNRSDSLWYPSVRLFRQPQMGDWQSVIESVIKQIDLFKI